MYQVTIYYNYNISFNDISRDEAKGGGMMSEKDTPLTEAFFYILLALRRPNHGYGVIQEVEQLTGGRVVLGPGTLYGALQTMQKRDWIRIYSQDTESRKKKEYIITDLGRQAFETERARLRELLGNAALMEDGSHD